MYVHAMILDSLQHSAYSRKHATYHMNYNISITGFALIENDYS